MASITHSVNKNLSPILHHPVFKKKCNSVSQNYGPIFLLWLLLEGTYSWQPRGLRRRSAAARLLGSWVRIPPGAWMSVCCECCVLSGRCLCDELITRPEESYRLWCVVVCDLETSWMRRPWPALGPQRHRKLTLHNFPQSSHRKYDVCPRNRHESYYHLPFTDLRKQSGCSRGATKLFALLGFSHR